MQNLTLKNGFLLLRANWALAVRLNLYLSIIYLCFVPIIRGISNLDAVHSAECLEQSVALIGIFLFVPLSRPEQNKDIQEIVFSKKKSYISILLLRFCMSFFCLLVLVSLFSAVMVVCGCSFPFAKYVFGTLISSLTLGGCGFLIATCTNNIIAGYFLSVGYFTLNLLGEINGNSRLSLFSMSNGIFDTKYWLLAMSALCFLLVAIYERANKR